MKGICAEARTFFWKLASIWQIPNERAEVPELYQLPTFPSTPFMGSGSTAAAAVKEERHFIGYDVLEEYCAAARKRAEEAREWLDAQAEFAEEPESGTEPQPPLLQGMPPTRQGSLRLVD